MQAVYSVKVDSDDHAFLANGFVNHNTEAKLAPLAMQVLGDIDEDTVDFERDLRRQQRGAGRAPGALSRTCW